VLEIALRLTPSPPRARRTADALRRRLASVEGIRLASIDQEAGRTVLVIAVALGEPAEIQHGSGRAQRGLLALQGLLDDFRDCDPAFVPLPEAA
jgi:hypothetical protein